MSETVNSQDEGNSRGNGREKVKNKSTVISVCDSGVEVQN